MPFSIQQLCFTIYVYSKEGVKLESEAINASNVIRLASG